MTIGAPQPRFGAVHYGFLTPGSVVLDKKTGHKLLVQGNPTIVLDPMQFTTASGQQVATSAMIQLKVRDRDQKGARDRFCLLPLDPYGLGAVEHFVLDTYQAPKQSVLEAAEEAPEWMDLFAEVPKDAASLNTATEEFLGLAKLGKWANQRILSLQDTYLRNPQAGEAEQEKLIRKLDQHLEALSLSDAQKALFKENVESVLRPIAFMATLMQAGTSLEQALEEEPPSPATGNEGSKE